jgi:hypothetical protein
MAEEPQISTGPKWANNVLPACAVGMDLLRRFEEARPNDYDHVPPKGLFARPRPKLVTVPCSETCRKAQPLDDEYFVRMVSMKSGLHETDSSRDARSAALRSLTKPTKHDLPKHSSAQ